MRRTSSDRARAFRGRAASETVQPVLDAIARTAARLCEAHDALIHRVEGDQLRLVAQYGRLRSARPVGDTFPLDRGWVSGRAVIDRKTIHVHDLARATAGAQFPESKTDARVTKVRTLLGAPLLRAGTAVGVILIRRTTVRPFTAKQIALLKTFADQAALAMENARLSQDLQDRNQRLTEALERETATGDILRTISRSPTDVQPTLDAVAASAARLCAASDAVIRRVEDGKLRRVAQFGSLPVLPESEFLALDAGTVIGRVVLERRTLHIHDMLEEHERGNYPAGQSIQRRIGIRTTLAVPLVKKDTVIGGILIRRTEVRPFTDAQIGLLQTFADQAVIAIENVRLFTELEARNRDLTMALEQQTATGEILKVISSSPTDLQPVFETIVQHAVALCEAQEGGAFRFDGQHLHLVASTEWPEADAIRQLYPRRPDRETVAGRVALEKAVIQVEDFETDLDISEANRHALITSGLRSALGVPMMQHGHVIGTISVNKAAAGRFPDEHIALLKTFADQAVIAIENVRLFKELEGRNRDLTEALDQQTATSEILRVISRSPSDVQPTFEAIAASAIRLCEAEEGTVFRFDGTLIHVAAHRGRAQSDLVHRVFPIPAGRGSVTARAVLTRAVVHLPDVTTDPELEPSPLLAQGFRTVLSVPMLRDGEPVGAITVTRQQVAPFSDTQIALLQTFADQAVIAVENVRLFKALEEKNRALTASNAQVTQALDRQTATADVLRIIAQSPTELQPVLDAIAASAVRLCAASDAVIERLEGDHFYNAAHAGAQMQGLVGLPLPLTRRFPGGRAVLDRQPVIIDDIHLVAEREYPDTLALLELNTIHSVAEIPLLSEGKPLGTIAVLRAEVRPFTEAEVALLQTFADQAVIAIENVRLFKELEARNRDLTTSLDRQTATSEILRVISQSPTDVQPVFETIVRNAVRLCGAIHGGVYRFDGELVHSVANEGYTPEQLAHWRSTFPRPVTTPGVSSQAIRTRAVVRIDDVEAAPGFEVTSETMANLRARGSRSLLAVPMLRQDAVIGAIALAHRSVAAFSDTHVELLKTFADQAVIAVENVRLFKELEARNHDLTETLEQQTATSEILRVIASSPTDVQPVFTAVAASAARLCDAFDATIFQIDGDRLRVAVHDGPIASHPVGQGPSLARETPSGRAVLDRRTIHVADAQAETDEYPEGSEHARRLGFRTVLAVPLMREGLAIGVINLRRAEAQLFTERQVALLETFADQAVIAIENVRLFTELEERNRELRVALEQQTATSELLKVIGRSTFDLQPVFETLAENAVRLCEAERAFIMRFDGQLLRVVATHNVPALAREFVEQNPIPLGRQTAAARAALERGTIHIHDVRADPEYTYGVSRVELTRTILGVPMLRADELLGVIVIYRHEVRPFTDNQIALIETFADQAAIAIENARLLNELQARNRQLTEALEQQTATAEILRVISSSPTNLQPVLDAVAESATRLCEALDATILLREGDAVRPEAHFGPLTAPVGTLQPLTRGWVAGRTVLDGQPFHVTDLTTAEAAAEFPEGHAMALHHGHRATLAVPLIRETVAIGAILVRRREPRPFSDKQVVLLRTFADQAVIAIENVRLFKELESRNRELTQALDQQTATGEILRAISSSPTDVQPVFDVIARSAARLCDGYFAMVAVSDGERLHLRSTHNMPPEWLKEAAGAYPTPLAGDLQVARAVRERRVIQVLDMQDDPDVSPGSQRRAQITGYRTWIGVPMLGSGGGVGTIAVSRRERKAFSDNEIDLLKTFADQAVIAIENVRLFKELEARNSDLTEALEQQTATGEILRVISSSPTDVHPVFDAILASATRLCDAHMGLLGLYDGEHYQQIAYQGVPAEFAKWALDESRPASRSTEQSTGVGRMIASRAPVHIADLMDEPLYRERNATRLATVELGRARTFLAVPMIKEDRLIGGIVIYRPEVRPFTDKQVELLQLFANQAVIAIENVRLFKELESRNRELTTALEQQTATAEILGVISSSPTDLQPVFDAIVESAATLCGARFSALYRYDGELVHVVAHHNLTPEVLALLQRLYPQRPAREIASGRAILDAAIVHLPDVLADPDYRHEFAIAGGWGSLLAVPMMREGRAVGTINIYRAEAEPFPENQIALLKTFADQAVIAIENVRLFNELQGRTAQLTRSVDELTALGEVSRALSSTLDLESVLNTIVARASQLAGTDACSVYEYDEARGEFHWRATANLDEAVEAVARRTPIPSGEGAQGRMAVTRAPVQIPDIAAEDAYRGPLRDVLLRTGTRAVLAVPLLRDDRLLGGLTVNKKTPGEFSPEVIDLLKTFATQSALAINNARLFREIEDKGRQLEVASLHKSQFLANMSHELRTPLNAILGYTELIADNIYGEVPERMREVLERVDKSGRHLLGLINDILDLSKIEAGQLTLALGPYAMDGVAQTVATQVGALAAEKQLEFEVVFADDLPIGQGDERRLTQVLLNLVGNAIKFTDAGKVVVRVGTSGDAYVVSVTDTGPGIAEADREKIFEEFQQADTTRAKAKGGTGLGLAISRRIVEMHGGRLWVESTLGEGSTFSFTVPVHVEQQVALGRQGARS